MKGKAPLERLETGPPPSIPKRSVALSGQKEGPMEHEGGLDVCLHKQGNLPNFNINFRRHLALMLF